MKIGFHKRVLCVSSLGFGIFRGDSETTLFIDLWNYVLTISRKKK